jgi:hypothetical protein
LSKYEKDDLLEDSHKNLARLKKFFRQLFNVKGAGDVRQTEIETAKPSVPEPSISLIEVAIGKLKSCR